MKRIKLFGFNIWISREPLRVVHKDRKRNSYRSSQRNLRLEMTENRCEVCGKPIDKSYTACEQSMWRSVEEELPEENQTALCRLDDGEYIVARFEHMDVYIDDKGGVYEVPEWWVENGCESYTLSIEITHWMPIPKLPSLPDTKTESK